jgi:hypothetical protein
MQIRTELGILVDSRDWTVPGSVQQRTIHVEDVWGGLLSVAACPIGTSDATRKRCGQAASPAGRR